MIVNGRVRDNIITKSSRQFSFSHVTFQFSITCRVTILPHLVINDGNLLKIDAVFTKKIEMS